MRAILFSLCLMFLSHPLMACAVCFTNKGNAREAFIWTAAMMTFVPLFLIGGGVLVIRKLLKEDPDQLQQQALPEPEMDDDKNPEHEKAGIS